MSERRYSTITEDEEYNRFESRGTSEEYTPNSDYHEYTSSFAKSIQNSLRMSANSLSSSFRAIGGYLKSTFKRGIAQIGSGKRLRELEAIEELKNKLYAETDRVDLLSNGTLYQSKSFPTLGDTTFLRFLIARKMDIEKAFTMIVEYISWRLFEYPENSIQKEDISKALADKKVVVLKKRCKLGRPCVLIVVRKHSMTRSPAEETRKLIIFSFDKIMSTFLSGKHGMGKAMIIVDLQKITWNCLDGDALKEILLTAQNYYPERLGTMVLWKPPSIFWVIWKVVSPFLDVKTRGKVQMVYKSKDMGKLMNLEEIPQSIGGAAVDEESIIHIEEIQSYDDLVY